MSVFFVVFILSLYPAIAKFVENAKFAKVLRSLIFPLFSLSREPDYRQSLTWICAHLCHSSMLNFKSKMENTFFLFIGFASRNFHATNRLEFLNVL